MFVAWLPALGVSPRVCLALNQQLRVAGGGGRSLAACLALSPSRAGSCLGWELAEVFGGQSRAGEQPVCGRVGVPLQSERTVKAEGTESQHDSQWGTCWCPIPSAVASAWDTPLSPQGAGGAVVRMGALGPSVWGWRTCCYWGNTVCLGRGSPRRGDAAQLGRCPQPVGRGETQRRLMHPRSVPSVPRVQPSRETVLVFHVTTRICPGVPRALAEWGGVGDSPVPGEPRWVPGGCGCAGGRRGRGLCAGACGVQKSAWAGGGWGRGGVGAARVWGARHRSGAGAAGHAWPSRCTGMQRCGASVRGCVSVRARGAACPSVRVW